MTDTGWKNPLNVSQYAGTESDKINKGKCYPFSNLDNIKKDDESYADIRPHASGGIDKNHKSAYLYSYNYGFSIPSNATVKKISFFILVQQLTRPLKKKNLTYSISKFESVKLKVGASTTESGSGNNFATKCGNPNLPYKQWSTETTTTFSGTPTEWGLTGDDIISTINSGNFGVAVQFVGTVDGGWTTPAIAKMKMKIEYDVPELNKSTPTSCEFTKLTVSYNGSEVSFTNNVSGVLGTLIHDDYVNPATLTFNFYHKGLAGETPTIIFESSSLIMGANPKSYGEKKTSSGKYTLPSLHTGTDNNEKVYSQTLCVFPGVLLGEQTIKYTFKNTTYTLKFKVEDTALTDKEKAKFMNMQLQCIVKNCYFYKNHAKGLGGASCITSEFYNGDSNWYGFDETANVADNTYNENNGNACPNVFHIGQCKNK